MNNDKKMMAIALSLVLFPIAIPFWIGWFLNRFIFIKISRTKKWRSILLSILIYLFITILPISFTDGNILVEPNHPLYRIINWIVFVFLQEIFLFQIFLLLFKNKFYKMYLLKLKKQKQYRAYKVDKKEVDNKVLNQEFYFLKLLSFNSYYEKRKIKKIMKKQEKELLNFNDNIYLNEEEGVFLQKMALSQHIGIFGTTGSGKTNSIKLILKQLIINNYKIIFIDGKNDENLIDEMRELNEKAGTKIKVWTSYDKTSDFNYSILEDKTINESISALLELENYTSIMASTDASAVAYYKRNQKMALTLLLSILEKEEIKITIESIIQYLNITELKQLISKSKKIDAHEKIKFKEQMIDIPEETFKNLKSKYFDLTSSIKTFEQSKNIYSIRKFIDDEETNMLHIALDTINDVVNGKSIGWALINDLKQNLRFNAKSGKQTLIILDEFGAFANENIIDLLNQSRSANFKFILGFQGLSELTKISNTFKDGIMQSLNTYIVHRMFDSKENMDDLVSRFGTKKDIEKSQQTDNSNLSNMGNVKVVEAFKIHPNTIKELKRGEAVIRTIKNNEPFLYPEKVLIDFWNKENEK